MDDSQRTEYAQQAFAFNDLFTYKFARQIYGIRRARRLRLNEPAGPSTSGGRQARQPLVLVPDEGQGNLVLGWVDATLRHAEIRSYDVLREQFVARFSVSIDLEREAYDQLRHDLEGFLKTQKIEVLHALTSPVADRSSPHAADAGNGAVSLLALLGMLVVGIIIGLGLGYVLFKS